jgi:hypothetical protein
MGYEGLCAHAKGGTLIRHSTLDELTRHLASCNLNKLRGFRIRASPQGNGFQGLRVCPTNLYMNNGCANKP